MRFQLFRAFFVVLLAGLFSLSPAATRAQTPEQKVERLIKAAGFSYKTHSPNVWSVEFDRPPLGKYRVILSVDSAKAPDLVVTFVTAARKAQITRTPKLDDTLLRANNEYDYVKIGFDDDGDLFVRADNSVRTMDGARMKEVIDQVANATKELATKIAASVKR
jgi:hypothetical protein